MVVAAENRRRGRVQRTMTGVTRIARVCACCAVCTCVGLTSMSNGAFESLTSAHNEQTASRWSAE
jgi:hypothetical protein